ncbi:MAG: DUF3293 domain-containing protein [Actinomycetota bacterium]
MTNRAELWRTWLAAQLWIEQPDGLGWWHVSPRPNGAVDAFPLAAPIHLLTAFNPRGEELSLEENERRLAQLAAYLRAELLAAVCSLGASDDESWMEPGFALLDVSEAHATAIGRRFEQAAIYAWSEQRLEVVGALDEGRASVGWSLDDRPPPTKPVRGG